MYAPVYYSSSNFFIGRNLFQPRKIIDEYHKNALTVQFRFASLAQLGGVRLESVMWAQLYVLVRVGQEL